MTVRQMNRQIRIFLFEKFYRRKIMQIIRQAVVAQNFCLACRTIGGQRFSVLPHFFLDQPLP